MRDARLLVLLLLVIALPGLAQAPGIDWEANLRRLQEMRTADPELYARLHRNFERFRTLSPAQQEQLRALDRDLYEQDPADREQLLRALSEYESWLSRLSESNRKRVLSTPAPTERLNAIREIRDEQWVRSQPLVRVRQWENADPAERRKLVTQWRQQEKSEREEWAVARKWEELVPERPMMPMGLDGFRQELMVFIEKHLMPSLSPQEKARISGKNVDPRRELMGWLRAIAEISDEHPVLALEPRYLRKAELPDEYREALDNPPAELTSAQRAMIDSLPAEGRWPEYPVAVTRLMRAWKVPVKQQLGPSTAAEFTPAIEKFVAALSAEDQAKLKSVTGLWPEYPLKLHEIARERKLTIPNIGLPGDPRMWERVRSRSPSMGPEPSEWQLRMFAFEQARKDPRFRQLDLRKPEDREFIKREYNKSRAEGQRRPPGLPDRHRGGGKRP